MAHPHHMLKVVCSERVCLEVAREKLRSHGHYEPILTEEQERTVLLFHIQAESFEEARQAAFAIIAESKLGLTPQDVFLVE